MLEIEKAHPGISKALYKRFGISNFGRFDKELLINQYEQMDNDDLPFGIAVVAQLDSYKNALHSQQLKYIIWQAQQAVKDMGYLRIFEIGSKKDIGRLYHKCKKYYPNHSNEDVIFCLLFAHGSTCHIDLKSDNVPGVADDYDIDVGDLRYLGNEMQKLGKLFRSNAQLIIDSCQVGGCTNSIADVLAKGLNIEVICPVSVCYLKSIWSTRNKNGLRFRAKYSSRFDRKISKVC